MKSIFENFSTKLLAWFDVHGRKNLPWQIDRDPYRVWISEIMLQQTQVQTVIPYFNRFIQTFPNVGDLARASEEAILAQWSGLGYYTRARNIAKTAKLIVSQYKGQFPDDPIQLKTLPGIGESTAAAITSQAFNKSTAILDGNVKRVISRFFLVEGHLERAKIKKTLWHFAKECMPTHRCADYTQAIMDFGATCCTQTNPKCPSCPLKIECLAFNQNRVNELPHKKPKKTIPTQSIQFIIFFTSDLKLYFEKRPSSGVWGGLWCFPSIEVEEGPLKSSNKEFTLEPSKFLTICEFKHSFTHFHLSIRADAMAVSQTQQFLTGKWFDLKEISNLGIPKPIRKICELFEAEITMRPQNKPIKKNSHLKD